MGLECHSQGDGDNVTYPTRNWWALIIIWNQSYSVMMRHPTRCISPSTQYNWAFHILHDLPTGSLCASREAHSAFSENSYTTTWLEFMGMVQVGLKSSLHFFTLLEAEVDAETRKIRSESLLLRTKSQFWWLS